MNTVLQTTVLAFYLLAEPSQDVVTMSLDDLQKHKIVSMTAQDIRKKVEDTTVTGEYLGGYRYIAYMDKNGSVEGRNHVGSHHFGKWTIDDERHTLSIAWDGWADTVTKVYMIDGLMHMFDVKKHAWRSVFTEISKGKKPLVIQ